MGKYQRLLLRACMWLLLFCLPISAFGADKVTLQLIWKNQFQFAGYYVAKELGFYEDAGLDGYEATRRIRKWENGMRNSEGGMRNENGMNSELKSKIQNLKLKAFLLSP